MNKYTANTENLKKQLQRTHQELNVLYNFSNVMRTSLELQHVLYVILTGVTAHSGLGFNRALLFLVDNDTRSLEAKMAVGPDSIEDASKIWKTINTTNQDLGDLVDKDTIAVKTYQSKLFQKAKDLSISLDPLSNNLLTYAYHKGEPTIFRKADMVAFPHSPLLDIMQTDELAIVPLKAHDLVNGLIVADNFVTKRPITNDDLKIFAMMANQAGLAIENSQLYEIVVQKSQKDSLTSLWNHGYFQISLNNSLSEARKNNHPLSLLMIDIDNFKRLNDTYGHQHGDKILKEIADLLKQSSRDRDCVCRYGGEEFAMILQETNKEHAFEIAERLRQKILDHKFSSNKPNQNIKISVSIGLAAFPNDADSKEELIKKADKVMYIAKFGGKNQVCVFDKDD